MEAKLKHLEFIQGVINRVGSNAFRLKDGAWHWSPSSMSLSSCGRGLQHEPQPDR